MVYSVLRGMVGVPRQRGDLLVPLPLVFGAPMFARLRCGVALWVSLILLTVALSPSRSNAQLPGGCSQSGVALHPCPQTIGVSPNSGYYTTVTVASTSFSYPSFIVSCSVSGYVTDCYTDAPFPLYTYPGDSVTFDVYWDTGTWTGTPGKVLVKLQNTDNNPSHTLIDTIKVQLPDFAIVDTAKVPLIDERLSLCAAGCFAGSATFTTVPFYTRDTPQSLTLVYTEDRAHAAPFVIADVAPLTNSEPPYTYEMTATLNGNPVTFINGESQSYFYNLYDTVRVAQQIDASTYPTGRYTLATTITAIYYSGSTISHTTSRTITIVNEKSSPVGRGWTIAGWQRLYVVTGGYLITDGTGDAVFFSSLGTLGSDYTTLRHDSTTNQYIRTAPDSTRWYFTASGVLTQTTDRLSDTTRYFSTSGRLDSLYNPQRVTAGAGTTFLKLTYSGGGLSAITEMGGAGRSTTFNINPSDSSITTITDPDTVSTKFRYDSRGRLDTLINRRRDTTVFQYVGYSGKLAKTLLPRIAVDSGSGKTKLLVPQITLSPWMTQGEPTSTTSSSSPSYSVLSHSILGMITDPIGRTTSVTVNRWGQPMVITDPASRITTITRSGILPTRIVGPTGSIDSISYSSTTGLPTRVHTVGDSAINYHYGYFSQVDSIWGPGQATEIHGLDIYTGLAYGIWYNHSTATETEYWYDSHGRVTKRMDAGGHSTLFYYNTTSGNLDSSVVDGTRLKTFRRLDAVGRDSLNWTSGMGVDTMRTTYDPINRLVQAWHAGDTTRITYDPLYAIRVVTPGNTIHKLTVNAFGWATARFDAGDTTKADSARYDAVGRVTSITNRRQQRVDRTYDVLDRLLSQSGTNGLPTDTYTYLNNGRVLTAWRPNVSRDSLYLSISGKPDSLIRKIAGHRYAFLYAKGDSAFAAGTRSHVTLTNDAGITFAQRLHRVDYPINNGYEFVYDSLQSGAGGGNLGPQQLVNGDGLREGMLWAGSYIWMVGWPTPSAPAGEVRRFTKDHWISWDSVYGGGRLTDSLTRWYTYDSLGHVTFAYRKAASGSVRSRYAYDAAGRLQVEYESWSGSCTAMRDSIVGDTTATGTCPSATVKDSAVYVNGDRQKWGAVYAKGHRLLTWPLGAGIAAPTDSVRYIYDTDGNVAWRIYHGDSTHFYWSATSQLDSVIKDGRKLTYEYNSYGQLVRRSVNNVIDRFWLWDGIQLIAELNSTGGRVAQYIYDEGMDHPIAIATDSGGKSKVRYLFQDIQGNVIGVVRDSSLLRYTPYAAWGQSDSSASTTLRALQDIMTGADTLRLHWKGLLYEGDSTRLYYVRNRWYDPQNGRFMSEDPLGITGGTNLYAFSNGDPVRGLDPSGECDIGDIQDTDEVDTTIAPGEKRLGSDGLLHVCTGPGANGTWEDWISKIYSTGDGPYQQQPAENGNTRSLEQGVVLATDFHGAALATGVVLAGGPKALEVAKLARTVKVLSRTGTVIGLIAGAGPAIYSVYKDGLNAQNGMDLALAGLGLFAEVSGVGEAWDGSVGLVIAAGTLVVDVRSAATARR